MRMIEWKKVGVIVNKLDEDELITRMHLLRGNTFGEDFSLSYSGMGLWVEFKEVKYFIKWGDLVEPIYKKKKEEKK